MAGLQTLEREKDAMHEQLQASQRQVSDTAAEVRSCQAAAAEHAKAVSTLPPALSPLVCSPTAQLPQASLVVSSRSAHGTDTRWHALGLQAGSQRKAPRMYVNAHDVLGDALQRAELHARLKHEDTKLAAERAQHNAAAKDLMLAQEEVLDLKRKVRIAVWVP